MNVYNVVVSYTVRAEGSTTSHTIPILRKANSASSAISTISALFGALSNYVDSNGIPFMTITNVLANIYSSDSSDEPEPEPDVTPENTDSEDNTNSEE